ncbi:helix-turn-helix transcriptional regulator [Rhizobium sp. TH2]|uniref:helix-turn-helix domain-containing protein n=1 Tax=Rhizobium sp. TH2 TaxID=2775403 RepID=UPI00215730A5|nr:helix-turn-helix transcriptional regulator [Rhizobium sp. TH2]UVC09140.1 helix-turn-helix transcriptional regulator [Rhizobium sp. TH2]
MKAQKILAWNIRKIRVELGLSQEKLAMEAGVERAYFGKLEQGTENVTVAIVDAIATALAVPVSELFRQPLENEEMPKPLRAGRKKP